MVKLKKESLRNSLPSSSAAGEEQNAGTWKPRVLNKSKSIFSLAQDFFNLNLDSSSSTKQAPEANQTIGHTSWNPLNSLRGARETLDKKFSTLTLRGGYTASRPAGEDALDENEDGTAAKVKRRKSLHSLHQAWGTVGRRLTLRGSRRAPLEKVDNGSYNDGAAGGSSLSIPLAGGESSEPMTREQSSSSSETPKTSALILADVDHDWLEKEDSIRCAEHIENAPSHAPSQVPQAVVIAPEPHNALPEAKATPKKEKEAVQPSPHVQWAHFHLHNPYLPPSIESTSPSSSQAEVFSRRDSAIAGLQNDNFSNATLQTQHADTYPFETLLSDNVSLVNVDLDEGHGARMRDRKERHDRLMEGKLTPQLIDSVDIGTYWKIVENASRMARNVNVVSCDHSLTSSIGNGPKYTWRDSARAVDEATSISANTKSDRKGKGKAVDDIYHIHYPDLVSGDPFVESFPSKAGAFDALFELGGNYDDHVLYDEGKNIYYPQIKGSPTKSEKELAGLRRVWLPMRTAPLFSDLAAESFASPSTSTSTFDVYAADVAQFHSERSGRSKQPKKITATEQLKQLHSGVNTGNGNKHPRAGLAPGAKESETISAELLDFQSKEREHFKKVLLERRNRHDENTVRNGRDSISSPKTRNKLDANHPANSTVSMPSPYSSSTRRNLDSGYGSVHNVGIGASVIHPSAMDYYKAFAQFSFPPRGAQSSVGNSIAAAQVSPRTNVAKVKEKGIPASAVPSARRFVRSVSYAKFDAETSFNPSFYSSIRKNKILTYEIFGDAPKAQLQPLSGNIIRPSLALTDRTVSQAITEVDCDFGCPLEREDSEMGGSESEQESVETVVDGEERNWRDVELYG